MSSPEHEHHHGFQAHCCPCCQPTEKSGDGMTRRGFLGGMGGAAALGGVAMTGLSWTSLSAAESELPAASPRKPLVVKPILVYSTPTRRSQSSWRNWGGIQTQQEADEECRVAAHELSRLPKNLRLGVPNS